MLQQDIINKMVEAMEIQKGELVLLHFWGEDNERDVLHMVEYAIARIGAVSISLQQSRSVNAELFSHIDNEQVYDKYVSIFDKVDTVIDLCMYAAVVPGENMRQEDMPKYRTYMRSLFTVLTKKTKFIQLRFPTKANAESSNLDTNDFMVRMEEALNIDYKALKEACLMEKNKLKTKNQLSLITGDNYKLSFDITDREWHMDAGDGDFPCGEIYIAPNEQETNGSIYFKKLYWDGECYTDVLFTIDNGYIIESNQSSINTLLNELPQEGRVIGELGIGLNPSVKELCGYTVLDEKMLGTVHIGIGMNQMFGGNNIAPLHMDFVYEGEWTLL